MLLVDVPSDHPLVMPDGRYQFDLRRM